MNAMRPAPEPPALLPGGEMLRRSVPPMGEVSEHVAVTTSVAVAPMLVRIRRTALNPGEVESMGSSVSLWPICRTGDVSPLRDPSFIKIKGHCSGLVTVGMCWTLFSTR